MTGELLVTVLGSALLISGALVLVVAGIGLIRLPDLYTRTSAIGTAAGLGVALLILGVVVLDFSILNLIKGLLAIVAQLLTSAIGSFALARAGYLTGSEPVATTSPDELRDSASRADAARSDGTPDGGGRRGTA
ncbi:cation:proton antiporter [Microcella flavibacter]|uniref:cation:proton antiporter n=1 Tax=Microcella flavibacter TaxID=1804990 RepID=UPI001456F814|nr:monovalent cation/H(+) antiporter subunit G [Microcella flavibacter]